MSKIPSPNVLVAFEERTLLNLYAGTTSYADLQQRVATEPNAILLGNTPNNQVLKLEHEYNFSKGAGQKVSQPIITLEILDPENIFEGLFIANAGKILDIKKNFPVTLGESESLEEALEKQRAYQSIQGGESGTLDGRLLIYITYGCGDDFKNWPAPIAVILTNAQYMYTGDEAKRLKLMFTPHGDSLEGPSINDPESLFNFYAHEREPLYTRDTNPVYSQDIAYYTKLVEFLEVAYENATTDKDRIQYLNEIKLAKWRITANKKLPGTISPLQNLDLVIWKLLTKYLQRFAIKGDRVVVLLPSVESMFPKLLNSKSYLDKYFYGYNLQKLWQYLRGDTPIPQLDTESLNYLVSVARNIEILTKLGFTISWGKEGESDNRFYGLVHPSNLRTSNKTSPISKLAFDIEVLGENESSYPGGRIPPQGQAFTEAFLKSSYMELFSPDTASEYVPYATLFKDKEEEPLDAVVRILQNMAVLSDHKFVPFYTIESDVDYIKYFNTTFMPFVDSQNGISVSNKDRISPVLLVGDKDLIFYHIYYNEIDKNRDTATYGKRNKDKFFRLGKPYSQEDLVTVTNSTGGRTYLFGDEYPPPSKFDSCFGNTVALPDEYGFLGFGEQVEAILKNSLVLKSGTSNPNVLNTNIKIDEYYRAALLTQITVSPIFGFTRNSNFSDIVNNLFLDGPFRFSTSKEAFKKAIKDYIALNTDGDLISSPEPNFERTNGLDLIITSPASQVIRPLLERAPDGFTNAFWLEARRLSSKILKVSDEEIIEAFINTYQQMISNKIKHGMRINTNSEIDSDPRQISAKIAAQIASMPLYGTLRTIPLFHVSRVSYKNRPILYIQEEPIINNKNPNTRKEINKVLTGFYNLIGFKHVITDRTAYSEFSIVKSHNYSIPEVSDGRIVIPTEESSQIDEFSISPALQAEKAPISYGKEVIYQINQIDQ